MSKALAAGAAFIAATLLGGCDPGVHIAWEKDFDGPVDYGCIEEALRTIDPEVHRSTWASDGNDPWDFPRGTVVTQFYYSDPTFIGGYQLNVAKLPNGKTRYVHQWGKVGTDIPAEEGQKVLPLLNRANEAVATTCGLSFAGIKPVEGDG